MVQGATTSDTRRRWVQFAVEWLLVIVFAVVAAQRYTPFDSQLVLGGNETEWITSYAYHAADGVRTQGRIPLWQPYMERGEPALESLHNSTLNPFTLFPSLIFGAEIGVRYSIITHIVIAGLGGWAIGWVLGFTMPARLLLAFLMLAKGSMPGMSATGFLQLATTQGYLPWVVAATIAIARFRQQRAPVVLLAVALTLLYFGGMIYYMLPALMIVGVLGGAYVLQRVGRSWRVDGALVVRYGWALLLTIALSAVTFVPLILQRHHFGGHPDENPNSYYETPFTALAQMFTPVLYFERFTWSEGYILYVLPIWFAAVLFLGLPPFVRAWNRPALPRFAFRLLVVSLFLGGFFFLWGANINPIMEWAYAHVPLVAQWRVVSRMLTLATLFVAIVVGLRFDGLWRAIILDPPVGTRPVLRWLGAGALIGLALLASVEVANNFTEGYPLRQTGPVEDDIMRAVRQQNGDREIFVIGRDYRYFKPYLDYHIRYAFINADAEYIPVPSTIYPASLRFNYAEYALVVHDGERDFWEARGYRPVFTVPHSTATTTFLLHYDEALPYAFAAPRAFLENYTPPEELQPSNQTRGLKASQVIALPNYAHLTDHVVLAVPPLVEEPLVVVLQELAYPGWMVTVDGQPAPLESVGGLIGVTLPQSGTPAGGSGDMEPRQIMFRYDPPLFKIGALITITTAVLVYLWLLRADVHWRVWRQR